MTTAAAASRCVVLRALDRAKEWKRRGPVSSTTTEREGAQHGSWLRLKSSEKRLLAKWEGAVGGLEKTLEFDLGIVRNPCSVESRSSMAPQGSPNPPRSSMVLMKRRTCRRPLANEENETKDMHSRPLDQRNGLVDRSTGAKKIVWSCNSPFFEDLSALGARMAAESQRPANDAGAAPVPEPHKPGLDMTHNMQPQTLEDGNGRSRHGCREVAVRQTGGKGRNFQDTDMWTHWTQRIQRKGRT